MDDELLQILSQPFSARASRLEDTETRAESPISNTATLDRSTETLYSGIEKESHSLFEEDIVEILMTHKETASLLREIILNDNQPPEVKASIQTNASTLSDTLNLMDRQFQVYVETASDTSLEREAIRLERRYFQSQGDRHHIEFIRLKRFYEKIKTFNEQAKNIWREVYRVMDQLSLIQETAHLVDLLGEDALRTVFSLIRKTDSFLEALRFYMKAESDSYDSVTNSYKLNITIQPSIRYTKKGFFGEEDVSEFAAPQEVVEEEIDKEVRPEDFSGSIARNIIIETRERRLSSAGIISVPILGSRDWNRTTHYRMEITIGEFNASLKLFESAFFVSIDGNLNSSDITPASAREKRGTGSHMTAPYRNLVRNALDDIVFIIVTEDFPGMDKPEVFLYHCGPLVLFNILLIYLQNKNAGEIFYLDDSGNIVREFPINFLKRLYIEWFTDRFYNLKGEDVDSYIGFSGMIEMVKKDYRILESAGEQRRKRESRNTSYNSLRKWLRDHRNEIFGARKVEIFKRFLRGTVFTDETDAEFMEKFLSGDFNRN